MPGEESLAWGFRVPGFGKLLGQVGLDRGVTEVVILFPVDMQGLVLHDQLQDGPEALGRVELCFATPLLPSIDRQELQGILWWQRLLKLLFTLRAESTDRTGWLSYPAERPPRAKPRASPSFVNKVFLEHSHTYDCFLAIRAEVND